jgi:hypothetical protein
VRAAARSLLIAAALALAGCGGGGGAERGPRLGRADAAPLILLAHRIAHEGACAQGRDIRRLTAGAIALVNARRVPGELAEPLMSGVNALAEQAPPCLPPVPQQTTTAPAPPPPPHGHEKHEKHGKHGDGHGEGG